MMPSHRLTVGLSLPNRGVLFGAITVEKMYRMAEIAERSEVFDSLWVGDSLIAKPRLEAVATLSALAARTTRVRLGTACLASFPLRHPVLFALQWASLDVISGGRSLLCVCMGASAGEGMGQAAKETQVFAFNPKERVSRFEEGITVVRRLWHETGVTHRGTHYQFDDVTIEPRPAQQPCPIWIANNPSPARPQVEQRAYWRVARMSDGWMTDGGPDPAEFGRRWKMVAGFVREAGKDPAAFPSSYHMMVNLGDDAGRAYDEGKRFLEAYYGPMPDAFLRVWLAAGPPEEVARRIQEYVDAGCKLPIVRFAAYDGEDQLRRFIDGVAHRLRPAP